jgi:hypothetical protein
LRAANITIIHNQRKEEPNHEKKTASKKAGEEKVETPTVAADASKEKD